MRGWLISVLSVGERDPLIPPVFVCVLLSYRGRHPLRPGNHHWSALSFTRCWNVLSDGLPANKPAMLLLQE